jgi:hypothetical protein
MSSASIFSTATTHIMIESQNDHIQVMCMKDSMEWLSILDNNFIKSIDDPILKLLFKKPNTLWTSMVNYFEKIKRENKQDDIMKDWHQIKNPKLTITLPLVDNIHTFEILFYRQDDVPELRKLMNNLRECHIREKENENENDCLLEAFNANIHLKLKPFALEYGIQIDDSTPVPEIFALYLSYRRMQGFVLTDIIGGNYNLFETISFKKVEDSIFIRYKVDIKEIQDYIVFESSSDYYHFIVHSSPLDNCIFVKQLIVNDKPKFIHVSVLDVCASKPSITT